MMHISHVALTSFFALGCIAQPTNLISRQEVDVPDALAIPVVPTAPKFNKRQYTINIPTIPTIPKVPDVPAVPSPTPRSRVQGYHNTVTAEGSEEIDNTTDGIEEQEENLKVTMPAIPAVPAVPATPTVDKRQNTINVPTIPKVPDVPAVPSPKSRLRSIIDSEVQKRQSNVGPIVPIVPGLLNPSRSTNNQNSVVSDNTIELDKTVMDSEVQKRQSNGGSIVPIVPGLLNPSTNHNQS